MEYILGDVKLVDSETLARSSSNDVLVTGTQPLDALLSPSYTNVPKNLQNLQNAAKGGGLSQGILHVLAGPQHSLSRVLMRAAVMAQLPPVDGGVNARRVLYVELNNFFDPYAVSQIAMERSLTPTLVLDKIEIFAKLLPARIVPGCVVLVSGLTSFMNPADPSHFEGLREMIGGLKKCQQAAPVHIMTTVPIADGSMYKPRGGHLLYHFAGCIIAVSEPRETRSGSRVTDWVLVRHPGYPERTLQCWDHAAPAKAARKARARKGDLSTFRTLDDFTAETRRP